MEAMELLALGINVASKLSLLLGLPEQACGSHLVRQFRLESIRLGDTRRGRIRLERLRLEDIRLKDTDLKNTRLESTNWEDIRSESIHSERIHLKSKGSEGRSNACWEATEFGTGTGIRAIEKNDDVLGGV